MSDRYPAKQPPEWVWPRWYLITLGVFAAVAVFQSAIPSSDRLLKALGLVPVFFGLDVLAAIAIALRVSRPIMARNTVPHALVAITLFVMGTAAFCVFTFFACHAASRF